MCIYECVCIYIYIYPDKCIYQSCVWGPPLPTPNHHSNRPAPNKRVIYAKQKLPLSRPVHSRSLKCVKHCYATPRKKAPRRLCYTMQCIVVCNSFRTAHSTIITATHRHWSIAATEIFFLFCHLFVIIARSVSSIYYCYCVLTYYTAPPLEYILYIIIHVQRL